MDKAPEDALDTIRQQLQVILTQAELCENSVQCENCAHAVCEIVKEIRALEAFVRDTAHKNSRVLRG